MEGNFNPENQWVLEGSGSPVMKIDSKRARFPCSIVWTPLPVISWLVPFIGHVGICREDGVILDFAGPNFICVDNFAFGAVSRYIQINKEKCCFPLHKSGYETEDQYGQEETCRSVLTWDDALQKSTQEYQHRSYNLFTCNCHSFVANNLNRLDFQSSGWNVVNLAAFVFINGRWVSKAAMVRSFLPFLIVLGLGVTFGGWNFIIFQVAFTFVLVGWFFLGTYVFKSLIHL